MTLESGVLAVTRPSISSMKMMAGEAALALEKIVLMAFSLSPTYLFRSSGPLTLMKFRLDCEATALTSMVLLQPGGP